MLCNLGEVFEDLARYDEAVNHFEAALAIARESGFGRLEGVCLNFLGLRYAREGRCDESRHCFDAAEALVRAASDRIWLGIVLCNRAEAEHRAGAPAAAKAAFAVAGAIAAEVAAGPDSALGLALARIRKLLAPENVRESTG